METQPIFVVDSAPFINQDVEIFSKTIVTIKEVMNEIKDKKTREFIQNHDIPTRVPSEEAIKSIIRFSKMTGDFHSLSLTDIKVLALTLQLEWELKGRDHLRAVPVGYQVPENKQKPVEREEVAPMELKKKPRKRKRSKKNKVVVENGIVPDLSNLEINDSNEAEKEECEDEANESEGENSEGGIPVDATADQSLPAEVDDEDYTDQIEQETELTPTEKAEENSDEEKGLNEDDTIDYAIQEVDLESDSDDGEWITPSNLSKKKTADTYGQQPTVEVEEPLVACMTNDYAMQNVLLQMKLALVSPAGTRITRLKTWILRCHACFQTTSNLEKVFCPKCGNNTLIRTSVGVDENGQMKIYLKKDFQYRNRGTVYSIPAPKGGRNNSIILREDQKEYAKALNTKKRLEKKIMNQEMGVAELFGESRLSATGDPIIGFGRKNPNEVRGRRRK